MSSEREEFVQLVESWNPTYFNADELLVNSDSVKNGVQNSLPPRKLWPNALMLLAVLEELRKRLGVGVYLNSVYRSPAYNAEWSTVSDSQHIGFRAADFRAASGTPAKWAHVLRKFRNTRLTALADFEPVAGSAPLHSGGLEIERGGNETTFVFRGAIGVYSTFVHVDCRGTNKGWTGNLIEPEGGA